MIGATSVTREVTAIGDVLDLRIVVVDPRPPFATSARIGEGARVIAGWPDGVLPSLLARPTPVLILSHDPKIDLPALRCALASESPYIALLGSREAQESRRDTLRNEGFSDATLSRIHGPAGLDIGGRTAAEIALSILAELIAVRNERTAQSLAARSGSIHGVAW